MQLNCEMCSSIEFKPNMLVLQSVPVIVFLYTSSIIPGMPYTSKVLSVVTSKVIGMLYASKVVGMAPSKYLLECCIPRKQLESCVFPLEIIVYLPFW